MMRVQFMTFLLLSSAYLVKADYSCVCSYDVENPVLSRPDPQAPTIESMYEFDCKPGYSGYSGPNYAAVQISGKIGYVSLQSQIQQQTCAGDPSTDDLVPVTTTQMPTTIPTTEMSTTIPTTQMPTTIPTTQMPTTLPTTQMPTTIPATQITTTIPTTEMSTTIPTTQMQTTIPTTQIPTTITTTQMPTTIPTTQMPTTISTVGIITVPYHSSNVTNSVLRYVGVSYNLTNGNPARGSATPSMTDPGLLLGNRVFQLNEYPNGTSREVEVTDFNTKTCTTVYALVHNGKSYQEELSALVGPTADHPQRLLDAAFIFNQEFEQRRQYTENPQSNRIYQDQLTLCSQRKLRFKDEMTDREPISITRDFAKDVCDLPVAYDVNQYVDFLDKWGTSIVVEALLGTKELKVTQTTEQNIFDAVDHTNPSLLHHSGSYMGYASSLTLTRKDYVNNVARTANLGTNTTTYRSNAGEMVPVGLKLVPITYGFDPRFWKGVIEQFQEMGVCQDSLTLASIQQMAGNINRSLSGYFTVKNNMSGMNVQPLTDSDLQIPVTWPKGTYGLMKAKTGCPMGHVTWHEGWRVQDSSHIGLHHHFSSGISNTLAGTFNDEIRTQYCMKTAPTFSRYDRDWPKGSYCVLKKGTCPAGFSEGSIYWDDADFFNSNRHGGSLPDGDYNKNTRIRYCCRSDGSTSNPITLPVDRSFVLLRYNGACQKVYAMSMRDVYIEWDTASVNNKDSVSGAHPLDDLAGRDGHRLHFCFYYFNTGGVIIG